MDELKKQDLKSYVERVAGQRATKTGTDTYNFKTCPICKNGDHFTIQTNGNYFNSWGNCKTNGGSIIDFEMAYYGKDKAEAITDLKKHFNIDSDVGSSKPKDTVRKEPTTPPVVMNNYSSLIDAWNKNVGKTNYFTDRGLTEKTINKYKLGYSPEGHTEYGKPFMYSLPVNENYVIYREAGSTNGRYRNTRGDAQILNTHYITGMEKEIFIVEGYIDALSIEEAGYKAISLNSASNNKQFIELLKLKREATEGKTFILIPDNDDAGKKLKDSMMEEFKQLGLILYIGQIPESKGKDCNDYLRSDKAEFSCFLTGLINKSQNYVDGYLGEFLSNIMDDTKRVKPISTGFLPLNKLMGGGLYPGLYAIGGISSLGKTSIVLQISDYIAANGTDVIFFSLEMSKLELVAKSLSRELFANTKDKIKVAEIGTREVLNGEIKDVGREFAEAAAIYQKTAKNLIIHEGCFETGIDEIKAIVSNHIKRTGKTPVIVVDYLQILKGKERFSEKQNADYLVSELKRMSRDYNVPVIAVSSFNRSNYATQVSFESFKESGGIEYGCDVLIGLQLSVVKELDSTEKNKTANKARLDQAKAEKIRKVDFVILKQRNGRPNAVQSFDFYARNNYFKTI